jgi:hypothetical protein
MAERRVPVQRLDVPTSVKPVASTVDTYVRPAAPQTQASGLAQFVSAITPAIQAEADERLKVRLKREREIENGIYKNKLNQARQASIELLGNAKLHYENNQEEYLALEDTEDGTAYDQVKARRNTYFNDYLTQLEQKGTDPVIIEALKSDLATGDTAFMVSVFGADKEKRNREEINNKLTTSVRTVLDSGNPREQQLATLNDIFAKHVAANNNDFRTANDVMMALAEDLSLTSADNALTDWLKSDLSKNQFGIGRNAKSAATIEARAKAQANAAASGMTTQLTAESLANNAAEAYTSGEMSALATDRQTVLSNGKVVQHDPKDYIPYIESEFASEVAQIMGMEEVAPEVRDSMLLEANRKKYKFYSSFNLMPPELSQSVNNGRTLLTMGDLTDPDNLNKAKTMYDALNMADGYSSGGIISTALKGDDATRFRHLQSMINGGYDFATALGKVQGTIFTGRKVAVTDDDVRDAIDNNRLPWLTKEASARNIGILTDEVSKLADALMQTDVGITEEEAKKQAMIQVAKDFKGIKNTDRSVTLIKVESNAINDPVNITAIETALTEIKADEELAGYIRQGLTIDPLEIMGIQTDAGFEVHVANTGNPNQLYVYATPLGEEGQVSTQNLLLGTVSIWDFNANRLNGIKEQIKAKYATAVEAEQTSSAAPAVGTGTNVVEDTIASVEQAVTTDDDAVRQQALANIIQNVEQAIAAEGVDEEAVTEVVESVVSDDTEITTDDVETISAIIEDEGFKSEPYDDMGLDSVGHGLQIASLEPDERALIKDINNVTEDESKAVVALKVSKTRDFFTNEVAGFENLPASAQSGAIQMGFQLGRFNVKDEWPKFMDSLKRAGQAAEGSIEQASALFDAKFNMLYNVAKDGTIKATEWATQTKDRAFEVAETMVANIDMPSIINQASASTINAKDMAQDSIQQEGTVLDALEEGSPSSNIIAAPYKMIFSNAFDQVFGTQSKFTAEDIGEDTMSVIQQALANAEARGSRSVEYDDYPLTARGLKVSSFIANFKDVTGKRLSPAEKKRMEDEVNAIYPNNPIGFAMLAYDLQTDPVLKAAGFVGGFSIQKDAEGNKFIKEKWNFNNKSSTEGTIYKKVRKFFGDFMPISEEEGSEVFIKLN